MGFRLRHFAAIVGEPCFGNGHAPWAVGGRFIAAAIQGSDLTAQIRMLLNCLVWLSGTEARAD
jgi:hypothetical protein